MSLVKCEKLEHSMVELEFSVSAEDFKAAVDKAAKREGKKYTVPGFRKGKAPRHLIEKMYGAEVFHYDAINDLFPAAYEAAAKEANVEPVSRPEADVVSSSLEEGVVLKVKVAVKPEITVKDYKGLKAVKTVQPVEESRVDGEIERMRQRNARIISREGKAEKGDTAKFDFEGFVDGVAFEGGKAENYTLELGSGQFIPGFEDQINVVNQTLRDIGAGDKPVFLIFNKVDAYTYVRKEADDLLPETRENWTLEQLQHSWIARNDGKPCIFISARERTNIDRLSKDLYGMVREIHEGRYPFNNYLY